MAQISSRLVCGILLATIMSAVSGEVVKGTVNSGEGFAYIGKFCFDYTKPKAESPVHDGSQMIFDLKLEQQAHPSSSSSSSDAKDDDGLRVYLYDDEVMSWPSIYQKGKSCEEKITAAKNSASRKYAVQFDKEGKWEMSRIHVHEHLRPRFWYVVVANCKGLTADIKYEASFINQGGLWRKQFGVNEQGLNLLATSFFLTYLILIGIHMRNIAEYIRKDIHHPDLISSLSSRVFVAMLLTGVITVT
eukprot:jgi/Bigna1/70411/fgenesh1_pg.12_\